MVILIAYPRKPSTLKSVDELYNAKLIKHQLYRAHGGNMELYQHLIVGLDLSEDSAKVLRKAARIAADSGAKLTVAHITEPLAFAYGGDVPIDLSEAQGMIEHQAKKRLAALVEEVNISADIIVSIGETASELHHLAKDRAADLLVVGSHGRHGFAMLFGSVTKGVVSGASCDVLAIRV